MGITLDGSMSFEKVTIGPRVVITFRGKLIVVEAKRPEDLSACRILSSNFGLTVQHPASLVKIHRLGDIGRHDAIVLSDLGDAVDLDGERHRNAFAL